MSSATRDRYFSQGGRLIGRNMKEATEWAKANRGAFKAFGVHWDRDDDDNGWIDVTRDIQDEMDKEEEDAKTPDQVNAEAIAQLKAYVDRELLKIRMELSLQIEGLGK